MKSQLLAPHIPLALVACLAVLLSPAAARAQNAVPSFIAVGQSYQANGGGMNWSFRVLEIGTDGWIKVQAEDGERWIDVNMLVSVKPR